MSVHNLQIEKGRHANIPYRDRKCPICKSGEVEDEYHFLMQCQSITEIRTDLFDRMQQIFSEFNHMDKIWKFRFIVKCETSEISLALAKFLKQAYIKRDSLLATQSGP